MNKHIRIGMVCTLLLSLFAPMRASQGFFPGYKAYVAYQEGDYADAQKLLERQQINEPHDPQINYNLGNVYYHQGKFDAAKENFRRAVEGTTKDEALHEQAQFNWGNCFYRNTLHMLGKDWRWKKLEEKLNNSAIYEVKCAIIRFKDVLRTHADNERARVNLISSYELLKELEKKKQEQEQQKDQQQGQEKQQEQQKQESEQEQQKDEQQQKEKDTPPQQPQGSPSQDQQQDQGEEKQQGQNEEQKQEQQPQSSDSSPTEDKSGQPGGVDEQEQKGKAQRGEVEKEKPRPGQRPGGERNSTDASERGAESRDNQENDRSEAGSDDAKDQQEHQLGGAGDSQDREKTAAQTGQQQADSQDHRDDREGEAAGIVDGSEEVAKSGMRAILQKLEHDESSRQKAVIMRQLKRDARTLQRGQKNW